MTIESASPVITAPIKAPRPGWVGFRWGLGAGAVYGALLGGVVGYAANIYGSGVDSIRLSQRLFEIGIFLLPTLFVSALAGAVGGAITMLIIYGLLKRMGGMTRSRSWLIALGVCLALMLLVATPVLVLLYSDGNFWRGLEESMIVGVPFYFLPGIFYIVAMVGGTLKNHAAWFPTRG